MAKAQQTAAPFFNYTQKVSYQVALSYLRSETFSSVHPSTGSYHPLRFAHSPVNSLEASFALQKNHFITEAAFTGGSLKSFIHFTEPPPESLNAYTPDLVRDTLKFYTGNLLFGRTGTIKGRLQYEITGGLRMHLMPDAHRDYLAQILIPYAYDSSSNTTYYYTWFSCEDIMLVKNNSLSLNFKVSLKLKYAVTQNVFLDATVSYIDNPIRALQSEPYVHWMKYEFLNEGSAIPVSTGQVGTRFNQLQYGLGLSYSF